MNVHESLDAYFKLSIKQSGEKIDFNRVDDKTKDFYKRGLLYLYQVYERCPDSLVPAAE